MPNPTDPAYTPWGKADHEKAYAEGIVFHGTPSHGGFKLSAERLALMHPALRETDGWFEEDCAWAKVAFAFPECFTGEQREAAIRTLKDWCPDEYEAATGETLAPGDSHVKDQRLFLERHANDWIVIGAIRSDRHPGMVECIATIGGRRGHWGKPDSTERRYLVPDAEYDRRGQFGFVIDPDRHALRDGPSSFIARRAAPDRRRSTGQENASPQLGYPTLEWNDVTGVSVIGLRSTFLDKPL